MKLLFSLAFRNLLKHRARFIFTLIAVSLCGMFFFTNLTIIEGSHYTMLEDGLKSFGKGVINIYHKDYKENPGIRNTITLDKEKIEELRKIKRVKRIILKLATAGLVSKDENTLGVGIEGVNVPEILKMGRIKIIEGNYPFKDSFSILIGKKLSELMGVKTHDTVLILTQDYYGSLSVDFFKVGGVFVSSSPQLEKFTLIMDLKSLQNFILAHDMMSEIGIFTEELYAGEDLIKDIKAIFNDAQVLSWKEDMPDLKQLLELDSGGAWVVIYMLGFLVILIIFTTIFMNATERTREYGVMMSIGAKSFHIRVIVILEGIIIGILGGIIGVILGFALSFPFYLKPLIFKTEMYAEFIGYSEFRIMSRILFSHFVYTFLALSIFSLIASFFPARRISRLKPAEALRHV
jgi:putative ABC transport system permease protein